MLSFALSTNLLGQRETSLKKLFSQRVTDFYIPDIKKKSKWRLHYNGCAHFNTELPHVMTGKRQAKQVVSLFQ